MFGSSRWVRAVRNVHPPEKQSWSTGMLSLMWISRILSRHFIDTELMVTTNLLCTRTRMGDLKQVYHSLLYGDICELSRTYMYGYSGPVGYCDVDHLQGEPHLIVLENECLLLLGLSCYSSQSVMLFFKLTNSNWFRGCGDLPDPLNQFESVLTDCGVDLIFS